jgi:hypothetical protein
MYTQVLLLLYLNDPLSKLGVGSLTTHMNTLARQVFYILDIEFIKHLQAFEISN